MIEPLLSQSDPSSDVRRIIVVVGLLVLVLVAAGALLMKARRRLLGDATDESGAPLTLHDLRAMHARGDLSDEEFERAKAAIVGAARSRPGPPKAPSG